MNTGCTACDGCAAMQYPANVLFPPQMGCCLYCVMLLALNSLISNAPCSTSCFVRCTTILASFYSRSSMLIAATACMSNVSKYETRNRVIYTVYLVAVWAWEQSSHAHPACILMLIACFLRGCPLYHAQNRRGQI
jgi:hypothetical protein